MADDDIGAEDETTAIEGSPSDPVTDEVGGMTAKSDAEKAATDEGAPSANAAPKKVPAKRVTPKKETAKRVATTKTTAKKVAAKKRGPNRSTALVAQQAKFPRHSVEKALRIPKAIYDQNAGKPATVAEAARFTTGGAVTGPFRVEVSSSKKYGYLRSDAGKLALEDRARRAIAPQSGTDRISALQEAVLAAPDMSAVYSHYRGESLPDDEFFRNALVDKFAIPADKVAEFLDVFNESVRAAGLIDETGERPRLIDVGRDDVHKPTGGGLSSPKITMAKGTTCFVMQPFGGHLGSYYETIFRPAIEQAGLEPMRADAEIFHTGKIMDQVWRGIRRATVLVAELTSKNPNVFYELGLAHALEKPVVLVSSNQDDVPFDLRHIRVILYDQADPFWARS